MGATERGVEATGPGDPGRRRPRWALPLAALALVALGLGIGAGAMALVGDDSDPGQAQPAVRVGGDLRQAIHEHADFALYIRGERFDFGQPQFISDENKELSPNVHVHNPRHTVLHVHREGTTWEEFFESVGFALKDSTNLGELGQESLKLPSGEVLQPGGGEAFQFVVNGVPVDGIAGMNISALDRVLISFGTEDEAAAAALYANVSDEACIPQGICLDRGNGAGEHGEPCASADGQCVGS